MLEQSSLTAAVKIFKVLGNLRRVEILYFLENNEADVTTIVQALNLSQPQVSHQLAVLHHYQLISRRAAGRHRYYVLDDPHVLTVVDAMLAHVALDAHAKPKLRQQIQV